MEFIAEQTDRFEKVFPDGVELLDQDGLRSFTEDKALVLASMQLFNLLKDRPTDTRSGYRSYSDTRDANNPYHKVMEVSGRLPSVHYDRMLVMDPERQREFDIHSIKDGMLGNLR